jgi:hypothetical protein
MKKNVGLIALAVACALVSVAVVSPARSTASVVRPPSEPVRTVLRRPVLPESDVTARIAGDGQD